MSWEKYGTSDSAYIHICARRGFGSFYAFRKVRFRTPGILSTRFIVICNLRNVDDTVI